MFLLVDDVGSVFHLTLRADGTLVSLEPVRFIGDASDAFSGFPKKDFEEVTFDPQTKKVYLSVEGNGNSYRNYVGIYELAFEGGNPFSSRITGVKKLDITLEYELLKNTARNLGFEGMAVDNKYLYLGLEGNREDVFLSGGAYIYVVDKKELKILKVIETGGLGIETICGLFAPNDRELIGIDRNSRRMFSLELNDSLNVASARSASIETCIPGYRQYNYTAAIESVTMDDSGNVYMVDDPWKSQYVPADFIMQKLDETTRSNFRRYIPIIYKFRMDE